MVANTSFPSLHARVHHRGGRLVSLYEIGEQLSSRQLAHIVAVLRRKGYAIERIEFYSYGSADTLRHLFVWMQGQDEPLPYFRLDAGLWQALAEEIVKA